MTIQEKITQTQERLKELVSNHNSLVEQRQEAYNQILELQGALTALQDVNTDTDSEVT